MERREHEHSPLPWKWVDRSEHSGLASKDSPIPFSIYRESDTHYAVEPIADICNFPPATPEQTARQRANAQLIVRAVNEHTALVEQRDLLARMLATVIDANYGTSYHHIGDGDGIPEEQAKEIQEWWQAHLQQIQDEYNRKQALVTVEQGHERQAGGGNEK